MMQANQEDLLPQSPGTPFPSTESGIRHSLAHGAGNDPYDGPMDRFGRVTDLLWYDYGSSADLLRFKHGYDRASNRLYREEADTSELDQLYSYDDVNRLVQSEEGTLSVGKDSISSLNFKQQWSLDPTGNWSAFKEDTVAEYVFDGVTRLVIRKKYASGSLSQTRHFYHTAGWQTIEERLESGGSILSTADRQFTWGLRYIDDLVCRTLNSVHDYAYQDPNWNVILSSSALARVVYQPYGQIRATCPAASGNLDAWQHYFAGYRRDEDTGLYLVRHRVYQPELGCWVQRDPIGYRGSASNLQRYLACSPVCAADPFGLVVRVVEAAAQGIHVIGDADSTRNDLAENKKRVQEALEYLDWLPDAAFDAMVEVAPV